VKFAIITSDGIPVETTSHELKDEVKRRLRHKFWFFGTRAELTAAIDLAFDEVDREIHLNTRFLHPEHDPKYCPACGQFISEVAHIRQSSLPTHPDGV
jgi:hypothetical protein